MLPVTGDRARRHSMTVIPEAAFAAFGQVIDIGIELSARNLALLWGKAEQTPCPQPLQFPQRRVLAAVRGAGQFIEIARGLRPMPGNVAHPAERTIRRPHIALCSYAMECGAAKVIKRSHGFEDSPNQSSGEGASGS